MLKKMIAVTGLGVALIAAPAMAQQESTTVTCSDLNWTAEVLALNPDVGEACRSVWEKDGKLYAKNKIEVVRTRGNTLTYRALHTDGTKGESRSVTLDPAFRAHISGRDYRVSDLNRGQELTVYLPEDRFALAIVDKDGLDDSDMVDIGAATVMPTTASPLFLIGLGGGAFIALGGILGAVRRRLA